MVVVLDVDNVDAVAQSFITNAYFEARWFDARLAYDLPEQRVLPLDSVWNPRLLFVNQQRITYTLPQVVHVSPEGEVAYRQHIWGPFSQPLDVHEFPFDTQSFDLLITPAGYELGEVALIQDPERPSGISPSFSVADWLVTGFAAAGETYSFVPGAPIPAFRMSLQAKRQSAYFLLKLILPAILIVGMACTVFWLDPSNASTQIGVTTTSMLTLMAYRFILAGFVPPVPYLTRMDAFVLGATAIVFLILIVAVSTTFLATRGRVARALSIELHCRWTFPLAFLSLSLYTLAF